MTSSFRLHILARKKTDAGKPLDPVIREMSDLIRHSEETSRPLCCAKKGFVDEVVRYEDIRKHMVAFANSAYQNPPSICPHHHTIRSEIVTVLLR